MLIAAMLFIICLSPQSDFFAASFCGIPLKQRTTPYMEAI